MTPRPPHRSLATRTVRRPPPVRRPPLLRRIGSGRSAIVLVGLLPVLVIAMAVAPLVASWMALLSGTVIVVALALCAALAVEPLVLLAARRGVPRGVTVAVLAVSALGLLALVLVGLVPAAQSQFSTFQSALPDTAEQTLRQPVAVWLQSVLGQSDDLASLTRGFVNYIQSPNQLVILWGGVVAVTNDVAAVLTGAVFVFVLWIYFALALPSIRTSLSRVVRRSRRARVMAIVDEIADGVGRFVAGQVLIAVANGVVAFVVLTSVGAPTPILFGVVAALSAFIPVVGTMIGYGVAALICFTVSPTSGTVASVVLLMYMLFESYVVVPLVMRRAVQIPTWSVIVGAIAGAAVGGLAGAFFAVPVLGAAIVLYRRVLLPAQERR